MNIKEEFMAQKWINGVVAMKRFPLRNPIADFFTLVEEQGRIETVRDGSCRTRVPLSCFRRIFFGEGRIGVCFSTGSGDVSPVDDVQKKIRRAERFGVSVKLTEEEKRNSQAERFGTVAAVKCSEGTKKSLMHRFNIATELTERCIDEGEGGCIGIMVWMKFMAARHLTWNKNYNVKPREISEALERFTNLMEKIYLQQPYKREIVRLTMALVGRGGQGDVGQRIRDEILVIQRNNHCKSGMMEEWHQKLHNNSSADDVIICEIISLLCLPLDTVSGEALGGVVGAFRHMIQTKGLIVAFGVLTWTLLEYTLSSLPFPHRNQELLRKKWWLEKKKVSVMNSDPKMKHDVFLSFRVKDTRDNFVSHLCGCLRRKRIKTYLFDELPYEERYEESLKAIEVSRVSVIVFSENFGDSKFCLDEVVAILKCKKRFGQIVIPVLYHVDHVDIENQTGSFGEAFAKRQDKAEQIKEWKDGFTEAINLPGWSTSHLRDEEMLVNEIALDIERKLLRASRTKVIIEWSLVITNLMLEIPSCVFDQISATQKPLYTLAAMSMSFLSCLLCLVDLFHKGRVERVVWRWSLPVPWFHYPTQRSNRFGSFPDIVGLVCALCQTILTAVNYSSITHNDDSPIKFSVWPIMFALGLLCTLLIKRAS
ncbi:unnamed protein product [Brassica oleracea var. botrytis]